MERTNRSDVGDTEYSITQTSSAEDHVTYLARGKYAADQPIRDEDDATTDVNIENGLIRCQEFRTSTPTDNSVMCDGTLSKFFSPRPYSKRTSPISHVTWNQEKNEISLRHSFDDLPKHTRRGQEFSPSPSDKLPVIPPISHKEPIKRAKFGTRTPTDSSMMCRENLSTLFSPRPYSKSISPISHVTWNQPISDRFLIHSLGDSSDQTCRVDNSLTKETKDTHDDYKENETHMAEVVECNDKKENETHMAGVVEGDNKKENKTHMADVVEGDDKKENETHMAEVVEGDDKKENETHMAEVIDGDDHKENETHMAEVIDGDDHKENETHTAEVMEGRDGEIGSINDDEQNASGDLEELEQLKKAYEEILKKKEQIDELVERQQLALEEQDRILEDIMQIARAEHDGMETVAGEFANNMKTYTHFKEETTNRRLYHKEIEIQADILHEENEELAKEISDKVFNINEIEELRHIGLETLKEKTEEMKCVAEQMKGDNDRLESDIMKKVEEFSNLRMELNDLGIPYVSKRKPVQVKGIKTKKPLPLIENPLKSNTESLIEHLSTTDTARYEKTLKNVLQKVAFASNKEVMKQVTGESNCAARRNEGSGGEIGLCFDKGSEIVEDLNKNVEDFEKTGFEMKLKIEGFGGKMDICYDKESEKVQDLNKGDDDFERITLKIERKIGTLSSDLDTLHRQEGFAEGREKDDDINETRRSECLERHCMGDENNLTDKDNAPQEHYPGTQGFEKNVIEIDTDNRYEEKLKPTKQLSALELVRLPGKRDRKTKIPKPMFHPYGSAVRDGDRHVVSKKSATVVVLRKHYDRKRHVPESQRNAFEAVVGYFSSKSKIQPPVKYKSPLAHETKRGSSTEIEQKATSTKNKTGTLNKIRNGEIKSKINTGRQNIERRAKVNSQNTEMVNFPKDENQRLKKSLNTKPRGKVTETFKPRKSEIKSRIDTGLNAARHKQENPVQKKAKMSNQNESKSNSHVQKDSIDTGKQVSHARSKIDRPTKPTVSRKKPKSKQQPPLSEEPLPKIKSARKQEEQKLINNADKRVISRCSLPPIGRSSTTGHDPDYKVNVSIGTSSCGSMASTPLSPFTHSVVGKLSLLESDHFTSLTGFGDPFISPSLSPSKRRSPPIATSPTKHKLHPEPKVIPLHRKHILRKSNEQNREAATTWPLFSPTPPQSPPPSSRRTRKLRNMPVLDNSPTIDPDRKPHLRA